MSGQVPLVKLPRSRGERPRRRSISKRLSFPFGACSIRTHYGAKRGSAQISMNSHSSRGTAWHSRMLAPPRRTRIAERDATARAPSTPVQYLGRELTAWRKPSSIRSNICWRTAIGMLLVVAAALRMDGHLDDEAPHSRVQAASIKLGRQRKSVGCQTITQSAGRSARGWIQEDGSPVGPPSTMSAGYRAPSRETRSHSPALGARVLWIIYSIGTALAWCAGSSK
jgi:hypothetical protein